MDGDREHQATATATSDEVKGGRCFQCLGVLSILSTTHTHLLFYFIIHAETLRGLGHIPPKFLLLCKPPFLSCSSSTSPVLWRELARISPLSAFLPPSEVTRNISTTYSARQKTRAVCLPCPFVYRSSPLAVSDDPGTQWQAAGLRRKFAPGLVRPAHSSSHTTDSPKVHSPPLLVVQAPVSAKERQNCTSPGSTRPERGVSV